MLKVVIELTVSIKRVSKILIRFSEKFPSKFELQQKDGKTYAAVELSSNNRAYSELMRRLKRIDRNMKIVEMKNYPGEETKPNEDHEQN